MGVWTHEISIEAIPFCDSIFHEASVAHLEQVIHVMPSKTRLQFYVDKQKKPLTDELKNIFEGNKPIPRIVSSAQRQFPFHVSA